MLFSLATFMSTGGLVWVGIMLYLDLYGHALVPAGYVLLSIVNLGLISRLSYRLGYTLQITISLVLPFFMQAILGGYYASGLVMLWSSISFLAVLGTRRKINLYSWIVAFVVFYFAAFFLDPLFRSMRPSVVTDEIAIRLLMANILMIGAVIFVIAERRVNLDQYFIQKLKSSNQDLEDYKLELEGKIFKRTTDLEASVEMLKETKNEMKRAMLRAQEATESKSYYLTSISHEIRTPLNAILGYTQIMQMRMRDQSFPSDLKEFVGGIETSGTHLLELINNVLDLSRIDSGKMTLSMETVNLRQLVKRVYEISQAKASQKGLHCSYSISADLPEDIETDATKLNQILMNLCSNALKFTDEGKRINISVVMEGKQLVFRVEDEGIGIESDKLELIFQPFTQANNTILKKYGGTGLGLAITKRLVELFGGQITVESKQGEGSRFTVRLPLIRAIMTDHTPSNDVFNLNSIKFTEGQKVLVVEDNPVNMQVLCGFLQETGLRVLMAMNGKEGISMAMEHKPDAIFMDIHMPVMDGIEATRTIANMDNLRGIPVICLTADVFGEQKKNYLNMGFSDFLTKPVEFRKIIQVLEKYLLVQK
ncbi:MAG: response regulator [Bacteroidetes bacterium]|nr:response regulator [Bacteroidota bacterium]